jgi:hypothetical protein
MQQLPVVLHQFNFKLHRITGTSNQKQASHGQQEESPPAVREPN